MTIPFHVKQSPLIKRQRDELASTFRLARKKSPVIARLLWQRYRAAKRTLLANILAEIYGGEMS